MLHMIIATHDPDMCPIGNPQIRKKYLPRFQQMEEMAKAAGLTIQGSWTDVPGHSIYIIVDAPNAHVVSKLIVDTQLMEWNTLKVNPIISLNEAMTMANK